HAAVGDVGQPVLEGQLLELALQPQYVLFGALALTDVEHEADQGLDLALRRAHYVHHVAYPDVAAVGAQGTIVSLVIIAGLRLRDAVTDHPVAVFRVHAGGPVVHADPALRAPAEEFPDLRADIGETQRLPVDPPRDGAGGFEQGL